MFDQPSRSGEDAGISAIDIAALPETQAQIMLFLLREQNTPDGVTLDTLKARFETLTNLAEIVAELVKQGWLVEVGEAPAVRYRIGLSRRARQRSATLTNLLARLGD
ncbi:MAG: hypothetical protein HXY40_19585 [Chloroflexi bacterium]|nr:hypothetical protein [Chloroflexota bacterium]